MPSVRSSGSSSRRVRIGDRLLAVVAADVRMHRVALDRTGTDERHLDRQVVEVARLQPRQRGHLRARLDLEHADRVGGAQHVVDARGFLRDRVEVVGRRRGSRAISSKQYWMRREHAQPEQVELDQADLGAVVLVPLQHGASRHPSPLDRAHLDDRPVAHDHAAGVNPQMPRVRSAVQPASSHDLPKASRTRRSTLVVLVGPCTSVRSSSNRARSLCSRRPAGPGSSRALWRCRAPRTSAGR